MVVAIAYHDQNDRPCIHRKSQSGALRETVTHPSVPRLKPCKGIGVTFFSFHRLRTKGSLLKNLRLPNARRVLGHR